MLLKDGDDARNLLVAVVMGRGCDCSDGGRGSCGRNWGASG